MFSPNMGITNSSPEGGQCLTQTKTSV